MEWNPIQTAPRDGTQVLLASVDEDGTFGIRQGFYESGRADRCWYDIDGEEIEPKFWTPILVAPPGCKL
jgi:hypothetical protein